MSPRLGPMTIAREATSSNFLKFRYPLSACDVLSSDSQAPIEFFFPESPLFVTENIEEEQKSSKEEPKPSAE